MTYEPSVLNGHLTLAENDLLPAALAQRLSADAAHWLITGVAGFIGSNLLEALLRCGQRVTGIDNFATGFRRNLDEVHALVGEDSWARFRFIEGDVRDECACRVACTDVNYVLHQAALGSVPRSIEQPLRSFDANVDGFMRIIDAARSAKVERFVYASSSSVYGDSEVLPKREDQIGRPLSPYAATKVANELFADVFARTYRMQCIGLRYFNVFGPRQDPDGAYAAVIPRWTVALMRGETAYINGDGKTSRDFCFVANAVQANVLAALAKGRGAAHEVVNVAVGERASLNVLFELIRARVASRGFPVEGATPMYRDARSGDVRHSLADIDKARSLIGYVPTHRLEQGLDAAVPWYARLAQRR